MEGVVAVVWEKSAVEHFRVGQDNVGILPDTAALRGRRITVVHPCRQSVFSKCLDPGADGTVLVACQGFCGVEENGS